MPSLVLLHALSANSSLLILGDVPESLSTVIALQSDGRGFSPLLIDRDSAPPRVRLSYPIAVESIVALRYEYTPALAQVAFRIPDVLGDPLPDDLMDLTDYPDATGGSVGYKSRFPKLFRHPDAETSANPTHRPPRRLRHLFADLTRSRVEYHQLGNSVVMTSSGRALELAHPLLHRLPPRVGAAGIWPAAALFAMLGWAAFQVVRAHATRRRMREAGYHAIGLGPSLALRLEFGRHASRLPDAQEAAALPGVDVTSWRSLRRLLRTRLDGG